MANHEWTFTFYKRNVWSYIWKVVIINAIVFFGNVFLWTLLGVEYSAKTFCMDAYLFAGYHFSLFLFLSCNRNSVSLQIRKLFSNACAILWQIISCLTFFSLFFLFRSPFIWPICLLPDYKMMMISTWYSTLEFEIFCIIYLSSFTVLTFSLSTLSFCILCFSLIFYRILLRQSFIVVILLILRYVHNK
jgi:hypothetical protein